MNLSIIIPIYNGAEYVVGCLSRVLVQSAKDIEIICIDDGSTDGTAEVVKNFAAIDDRVRLICQPNKGAGVARDVGIKAAKGEYVAFLDADDFYPSADTLARLYSAAKTNNALICGGSFCEVHGREMKTDFAGLTSGFAFKEEGWINFRDYQFDYGFYRFIYNRQFLLKNDLFFPDYRRYQDPPFMLRAMSAAGRFYAVPEVTYCYRVPESGTCWSESKVCDLLCGIEDNLLFSAEKRLAVSHMLNYRRLNEDFKEVIASAVMSGSSGETVICQLKRTCNAIDAGLLNEAAGAAVEVTTPLSEIEKRLFEQNRLIKSEGWFIKNKAFRIYTFPVRALGLFLKRVKKSGKRR